MASEEVKETTTPEEVEVTKPTEEVEVKPEEEAKPEAAKKPEAESEAVKVDSENEDQLFQELVNVGAKSEEHEHDNDDTVNFLKSMTTKGVTDDCSPYTRTQDLDDARLFYRKIGEITRLDNQVGEIDYSNVRHPFKVFVGGVPYQMKETDVFLLAEREYGKVMSVKMTMDERQDRYHKGYAFLVFESQELRDRAIGRGSMKWNNQMLECKRMDPETKVKATSRMPPMGMMGMPGGYGMMGMQGGMGMGMPMSSPSMNTNIDQTDVPEMNKLFYALKGTRQPGIQVNEELLTQYFGMFGPVVRAIVIRDKVTFEHKGYGFIYYQFPEGPTAALAAGKDHLLGGYLRLECKRFGTMPGQSPVKPDETITAMQQDKLNMAMAANYSNYAPGAEAGKSPAGAMANPMQYYQQPGMMAPGMNMGYGMPTAAPVQNPYRTGAMRSGDVYNFADPNAASNPYAMPGMQAFGMPKQE